MVAENDDAERLQAAKASRPLSVVVAAILVFAMGLFETVVVASVAFGTLMNTAPTGVGSRDEFEPFGQPMTWLMEHSVLLVALQATIGLAALAGGAGLWVRRPWARRTSQITMGGLVTLWLGVGIVTAASFVMPTDAGPVGAVVGGAFRVGAMGVSAIWALVTGVPIWLLERREVKHWLSGRLTTA